MHKTVIAISLAAIIGIAYELSRVDGVDVQYEAFAADAKGTAPASAPEAAPKAAVPVTADDSIIWLDTVVVVAPRLEPEEDIGVDAVEEAPAKAEENANINDDVDAVIDRVVPIQVVSAPDLEEATPAELARARGKMSPPLRELAASGGYEMVDIIVSLRTRPDLFERDVLANAGGVVTRRYDSLNMRAIRIPAAALDEIAVEYNVKSLTLDSQIAATPVAANQY